MPGRWRILAPRPLRLIDGFLLLGFGRCLAPSLPAVLVSSRPGAAVSISVFLSTHRLGYLGQGRHVHTCHFLSWALVFSCGIDRCRWLGSLPCCSTRLFLKELRDQQQMNRWWLRRLPIHGCQSEATYEAGTHALQYSHQLYSHRDGLTRWIPALWYRRVASFTPLATAAPRLASLPGHTAFGPAALLLALYVLGPTVRRSKSWILTLGKGLGQGSPALPTASGHQHRSLS